MICIQIPIFFHSQGFYLYLYVGSIFFLIYVYLFLLRSENPKNKTNSFFRQVMKRVGSVSTNISTMEAGTPAPHKRRFNDAAAHCGSFYLRLGAVGKMVQNYFLANLDFCIKAGHTQSWQVALC